MKQILGPVRSFNCHAREVDVIYGLPSSFTLLCQRFVHKIRPEHRISRVSLTSRLSIRGLFKCLVNFSHKEG